MYAFLPFLLALQTAQLELGGHLIKVEIAEEQQARAEGLQGRKHLPDGYGMLFIFEKPHTLSFWMKDTMLPLSIGFFDAEHVLINTADMHPPSSHEKTLPLYQSRYPALYALELPLNWFRDHQVSPGMKFSFQDQPIEIK